MAAYLRVVLEEAASRGYSFDPSRITSARPLAVRIPETRGQLLYEWNHLGRKLRRRNPAWHAHHHRGVVPTAHPVFRVVAGRVREWERPPGPRRP